MSVEAPKLIPSGIEPVDKLLGGLESEQLYLVYGDASAPSLFGVKFLIEGLKRKETVALVTRHSPEEAMRQFVRLGYDCLDDVETGRLIILEYSERVIEQVSRLSKLTPILQELQWWFKEPQPRRFVFDSISSLISVANPGLKARAREFAERIASFKATVLLVDSDQRNPVIKEFIPLVKESFRLAKEDSTTACAILTFEKSAGIADQPVEIDAFKGIFLFADQPGQNKGRDVLAAEDAPQNVPPTLPAESVSPTTGKAVTGSMAQTETREAFKDYSITNFPAHPSIEQQQTGSVCNQDVPDLATPHAEALTPNFVEVEIGMIDSSSQALDQESEITIQQKARWQTAELAENDQQKKGSEPYDFSDFVAELDVEIGEFDLSKIEAAEPMGSYRDFANAGAREEIADRAGQPFSSAKRERISDSSAARALYLRRATDVAVQTRKAERTEKSTTTQPATEKAEKPQTFQLDSKNFNVAVIDYDTASCGRITKALSEFNVEIYKDALSGVAGVIASPPDLVVLDVDTPIVDGFKLLAHIRASLPVPIIALSKFHLRASDRILSAELGADYYLTKPFSSKELQRKARQLIARYRGVNSWIATPTAIAEALASQTAELQKAWSDSQLEPAYSADFKNILPKSQKEKLEPYTHFIHHVEERVKAAMAEGTVFSMVGFRLEPDAGDVKLKVAGLFDLVSASVRTDDLISTNTRNDLVILLPDTDTKGAWGFINRLRKQITEELNENLMVWIRNFPNLEEAYQMLSVDDAKMAEEQSQEKRASNSARA